MIYISVNIIANLLLWCKSHYLSGVLDHHAKLLNDNTGMGEEKILDLYRSIFMVLEIMGFVVIALLSVGTFNLSLSLALLTTIVIRLYLINGIITDLKGKLV